MSNINVQIPFSIPVLSLMEFTFSTAKNAVVLMESPIQTVSTCLYL